MTRIGIVGIGVISWIYMENITNRFEELELYAVCDLVKEKAQKAVEQYNVPKCYDTMEELFADPQVDIVLNLTRPYEHFAVSWGALMAGKQVYTEKPLAAAVTEAKKLTELAAEKGLTIAGAPDTFLGAGIQTCKKLIEDGFIGTVVGASAHMVCRGHESWHEDPEFYYKCGGGPMLDMGPYYVTALTYLIGSVEAVSAMAKKSFLQRQITSKPLAGQVIDVEVSTYVDGTMRFENGAVGSLFTTFDVYRAELPCMEIYGTEGTLSVPDPNTFGGPVRLFRPEKGEFMELPLLFPYAENSRALGLNDMALALKEGRKPVADSSRTFHVLEVMEAFQKSSEEGRQIAVTSRIWQRNGNGEN